MAIKRWTETLVSECIENETHKFSIKQDKLEKLLEEGRIEEVQKLIQKGMRQIVDKGSGEWWEASWKEFFTELTKQSTLEDFKEV